jgi:ABC-2 type transport system permease protein
MAWSINFLAMSVVAALGMVWEKSQSLFDVWLGMYFALSGYLVPLDLFPAWLRGITDALPFRYMISVPARILTGDISGAAVLAAWLGQFAWIAVFGLLSSVAWRFGLKRWVAMGG